MPPAPPLPDGEENLEVMSFGEHLEELRHRIIRSLLGTRLFTIVALIFQSPLMEMISAPHRRAMRQVQG
ncbi:MAG: twin-arginine translocase subunit TatC, partial [Planctomycetota bacterium]